jgi:hypothetical protein
MENSNVVFLGTELKLNIKIDPIPKHLNQEIEEGDDKEWNMEDYDFEVEIFCSPRKTITITKDEAIPVDKNNYIVLINTEDIGTGTMKVKVIAHIPDGDFVDQTRTEVQVEDTGIEIIKTIE